MVYFWDTEPITRNYDLNKGLRSILEALSLHLLDDIC